MPQKKHRPEEVVAKLRQVDALVSQGRSVAEAVGSMVVRHEHATGSSVLPNQFAYYRWRKEHGGLKSDQVKRLKELEKDRASEAPLVQAQWRGSGCGRRSPT